MTSQNYIVHWMDTASQSVLLWRFPPKFIYSDFAQSYHDLEQLINLSPASEVMVLLDLTLLQAECQKPAGIINHLSVVVNRVPHKLSKLLIINTPRIVRTVIDIAIHSNPKLSSNTYYTETIREAYQRAGLDTA